LSWSSPLSSRPYLLETTTRFVEAAASLPDVELALITCEPADRCRRSSPHPWPGTGGSTIRSTPGRSPAAVEGLGAQIGPVQRLLAVLEQLQVPLAQVREHLGIPASMWRRPATSGTRRR
jgi:hypothetical protein